MSKTLLPFVVDDVSALARSLRAQLEAAQDTPGHLALLNMLVRAAGYKNFQHFRAKAAPQTTQSLAQSAPASAPHPADEARVGRLSRHFDALGRLLRWPSKQSEQLPCLWVVWSRIASKREFTEVEINLCLSELHTFGDSTLLRRKMCDLGMLFRTPDCRQYRRLQAAPAPLALALLARLSPRFKQDAALAAGAGAALAGASKVPQTTQLR